MEEYSVSGALSSVWTLFTYINLSARILSAFFTSEVQCANILLSHCHSSTKRRFSTLAPSQGTLKNTKVPAAGHCVLTGLGMWSFESTPGCNTHPSLRATKSYWLKGRVLAITGHGRQRGQHSWVGHKAPCELQSRPARPPGHRTLQ